MSDSAWELKGVDPETRQQAVKEAQRLGVSLADYLTNKVLQALAVDARAFDGSESDTDRDILALIDDAYKGMDDDFNTAIAIASLNEIGAYAHKLANQQLEPAAVAPWVLEKMKATFNVFIFNILLEFLRMQ